MKLFKSFLYALRGIINAVLSERNFRIHIAAAITVFIFSALYGITSLQAAILIMVICLVMSAELLNTAVEAMVDIISPEKCRNAKIAKDSAAGAVLVFAIGAVLIAICIFSNTDKLLSVLNLLYKNIIWLLVYIVVCAAFVFAVPYRMDKPRKNNHKGEKL